MGDHVYRFLRRALYDVAKIKKALFLILSASLCWADIKPPPLNVKTQDGTVSTYPYQLKLPNGSLTNNNDNTATVNFSSGSLSGGSTQYIQNTNALQAGSTFYVSSGTVNSSFNLPYLTASRCVQTDANSQLTSAGAACGSGGGGSTIYNSTATAGFPFGFTNSTQTITSLSAGVMHIVATSSNVATGLVSLSTEVTGNLPAGSIAAGSLGSNVIASSIAVNAVYPASAVSGLYSNIQVSSVAVNTVYPAGVSAGSYPNVTGVGTLTAGTWNATTIGTPYLPSGPQGIVFSTTTLQSGTTIYVSSATINGNLNVTGSAATLVGIGTNNPATELHMSSGTFTIDGNVSPAITIKGTGAPPDSFALCVLNGQLGHCTSIVGAGGGCTCSVP